jgi:hypothetical protein
MATRRSMNFIGLSGNFYTIEQYTSTAKIRAFAVWNTSAFQLCFPKLQISTNANSQMFIHASTKHAKICQGHTDAQQRKAPAVFQVQIQFTNIIWFFA